MFSVVTFLLPVYANLSPSILSGDYCNLPLYMKTDPFFRKQAELHDPCPVVPPREASIRSLAARAYHTQGRHMTLDAKQQQQALTLAHAGLSSLTSSASGSASLSSGPPSISAAGSSIGTATGASGGGGAGGASSGASGGGGGTSGGGSGPSSSTSTLPQRTLTMPGSSSAQSAAVAAAAAAAAAAAGSGSGASGSVASGGASGQNPGSSSKVGGSRDSLLESSSSGLGRLQKQSAGAYSKSYTLV